MIPNSGSGGGLSDTFAYLWDPIASSSLDAMVMCLVLLLVVIPCLDDIPWRPALL